MTTHVCAESRVCRCSMSAAEPNENCPRHGFPWPPRCGECGRLLPWSVRDPAPSQGEPR